MIASAEKLAAHVGKKTACESLLVPRATFYRHMVEDKTPKVERPAPPLALSADERQAVIDILNMTLDPKKDGKMLRNRQEQRGRKDGAPSRSLARA